MSSDIHESRKRRKVLTLRKEPSDGHNQPKYVVKQEACYMVWRAGGDMPKRVYSHAERQLACDHAKTLVQETGERFYVLRAWRAFDPVGSNQ